MGRRTLMTLALAGALSATTAVSGCYVHPRSAAQIATAAIWTAAIAGHLVILAHHDSHYHYEHCGHYRRWHEGRWVYYYQERWEYYDDGSGRWYVYTEAEY